MQPDVRPAAIYDKQSQASYTRFISSSFCESMTCPLLLPPLLPSFTIIGFIFITERTICINYTVLTCRAAEFRQYIPSTRQAEQACSERNGQLLAVIVSLLNVTDKPGTSSCTYGIYGSSRLKPGHTPSGERRQNLMKLTDAHNDHQEGHLRCWKNHLRYTCLLLNADW